MSEVYRARQNELRIRYQGEGEETIGDIRARQICLLVFGILLVVGALGGGAACFALHYRPALGGTLIAFGAVSFVIIAIINKFYKGRLKDIESYIEAEVEKQIGWEIEQGTFSSASLPDEVYKRWILIDSHAITQKVLWRDKRLIDSHAITQKVLWRDKRLHDLLSTLPLPTLRHLIRFETIPTTELSDDIYRTFLQGDDSDVLRHLIKDPRFQRDYHYLTPRYTERLITANSPVILELMKSGKLNAWKYLVNSCRGQQGPSSGRVTRWWNIPASGWVTRWWNIPAWVDLIERWKAQLPKLPIPDKIYEHLWTLESEEISAHSNISLRAALLQDERCAKYVNRMSLKEIVDTFIRGYIDEEKVQDLIIRPASRNELLEQAIAWNKLRYAWSDQTIPEVLYDYLWGIKLSSSNPEVIVALKLCLLPDVRVIRYIEHLTFTDMITLIVEKYIDLEAIAVDARPHFTVVNIAEDYTYRSFRGLKDPTASFYIEILYELIAHIFPHTDPKLLPLDSLLTLLKKVGEKLEEYDKWIMIDDTLWKIIRWISHSYADTYNYRISPKLIEEVLIYYPSHLARFCLLLPSQFFSEGFIRDIQTLVNLKESIVKRAYSHMNEEQQKIFHREIKKRTTEIAAAELEEEYPLGMKHRILEVLCSVEEGEHVGTLTIDPEYLQAVSPMFDALVKRLPVDEKPHIVFPGLCDFSIIERSYRAMVEGRLEVKNPEEYLHQALIFDYCVCDDLKACALQKFTEQASSPAEARSESLKIYSLFIVDTLFPQDEREGATET